MRNFLSFVLISCVLLIIAGCSGSRNQTELNIIRRTEKVEHGIAENLEERADNFEESLDFFDAETYFYDYIKIEEVYYNDYTSYVNVIIPIKNYGSKDIKEITVYYYFIDEKNQIAGKNIDISETPLNAYGSVELTTSYSNMDKVKMIEIYGVSYETDDGGYYKISLSETLVFNYNTASIKSGGSGLSESSDIQAALTVTEYVEYLKSIVNPLGYYVIQNDFKENAVYLDIYDEDLELLPFKIIIMYENDYLYAVNLFRTSNMTSDYSDTYTLFMVYFTMALDNGLSAYEASDIVLSAFNDGTYIKGNTGYVLDDDFSYTIVINITSLY